MARVGPAGYDAALRDRHVHEMNLTGRAMKGFVYVACRGFESDAGLRRWVQRGVAFAVSLAAK